METHINAGRDYLRGLKFFSVITKSKRGWSVARLNDKGGGTYEGTHTLGHAVYSCLSTGLLPECLPESIEVRGVKYSPAEAVRRFMKNDFWYSRIYPQFQVL